MRVNDRDEVAPPAAPEEKDLRMPDRRVQTNRHLVLYAPRAEPFGVDLAPAELVRGDEIRELQRAEITGCILVVADGMLMAQAPVDVDELSGTVDVGVFLAAEQLLAYSVELAVRG